MKKTILILSLFAALGLASCGDNVVPVTSSNVVPTVSSAAVSSSVAPASSDPESSAAPAASSTDEAVEESSKTPDSEEESSSFILGKRSYEEWSEEVAESENSSRFWKYRSVAVEGYCYVPLVEVEGTFKKEFGLNWSDYDNVESIFYDDADEETLKNFSIDTLDTLPDAAGLYAAYVVANASLSSYGHLNSSVVARFGDWSNVTYIHDGNGYSVAYEGKFTSLSASWNEELLLTKIEWQLSEFDCSLTFFWSQERLPDTTYGDEITVTVVEK